MEKYILDTNLFFNMEAGVGLGEKTDAVIKNVSAHIKKLKGEAAFYMPPRVVDEFLGFFEDKNQPQIKKLLAGIIIKSPDQGKINFSGQVFYQLIEEVRQRAYAGLNIAEEEIEAAGKLMQGKKITSKKDFQIQIGSIIKNFRDRYRRATRYGFLDSLADLDLIMLAKEIDGFLVSADEGVVRWGRVFGVKEMPLAVWKRRLEDLAPAPRE